MATKKISELDELTTADTGDYFAIIDVSDTTSSASGTTKKISKDNLAIPDASAVALNTAKVTNATHTGEVTGSTALTIADNVVDEANLKLDTAPTNDYVLTADSTASGGMKWAASAGGFTDPMTTRGDIIYKNAAGTTTRLAAGANGYVLTSDGTDISWAAAGGGSGAAATFERTYTGNVGTGRLIPIVIPDELDTLDVKEVRLSLLGLPAGQALKVDVRKNGTATTDSIFTSDTEIEIATTQTATNGVYQSGCNISGSTIGTAGTTIDATRDTLASDDVLWVYITQTGSTTAGADLVVTITVA